MELSSTGCQGFISIQSHPNQHAKFLNFPSNSSSNHHRALAREIVRILMNTIGPTYLQCLAPNYNKGEWEKELERNQIKRLKSEREQEWNERCRSVWSQHLASMLAVSAVRDLMANPCSHATVTPFVCLLSNTCNTRFCDCASSHANSNTAFKDF